MNAVFYMHLIATLVNMFFIGLLWYYNHWLISTNHRLLKDNRDILIESKNLQELISKRENK